MSIKSLLDDLPEISPEDSQADAHKKAVIIANKYALATTWGTNSLQLRAREKSMKRWTKPLFHAFLAFIGCHPIIPILEEDKLGPKDLADEKKVGSLGGARAS